MIKILVFFEIPQKFPNSPKDFQFPVFVFFGEKFPKCVNPGNVEIFGEIFFFKPYHVEYQSISESLTKIKVKTLGLCNSPVLQKGQK